MSFYVLAFLIILALVFDFMNGFHDAANAIATVVSTGVLKPQTAVMMAASFNFIAIGVFHLKVASMIGKGTIDPIVIDHYVVFGALVGAIVWNVVTWYFGLPSSSSHALIGGLVGAAVAKAGTDALIASGLIKIIAFIVLSPLLGFLFGSLMMVLVSWLFVRSTPRNVDRWFRRLQLVSAAMYSLGHGGNDAQKTMGIIWMLLIAAGATTAEDPLPWWVVISCYSAISLGTLFGGWRIVKTMGRKSPSSNQLAASVLKPVARLPCSWQLRWVCRFRPRTRLPVRLSVSALRARCRLCVGVWRVISSGPGSSPFRLQRLWLRLPGGWER